MLVLGHCSWKTSALLCVVVEDLFLMVHCVVHCVIVLQGDVTSVVSVGPFTYTGAKCRSVDEARQSAAALAVNQMTAQTKVCGMAMCINSEKC